MKENIREDIIEYLQKEVERRCQMSSNFFGMECYRHIKAVVKNAELLARQYGADAEIVTVAAWLHDIASITDYSLYAEHHIHGAEIAGEILQTFSYEPAKIRLVQKCILNHRGSIECCRFTAEEMCVADADAISHFDNIPSLLYLAYVKKKLSVEEGKVFVKNKLERSFHKLSDKGKEFFACKYNQAMAVLE